MTARGLHVLTGARFVHAHDECGRCDNLAPTGGGWKGHCTAKNKTVCCPPTDPYKKLCKNFQPARRWPIYQGGPLGGRK